MGYDWESCMAKTLLSILNFLLFIPGTIAFGVGIWLLVDKNSFIALLKMVDNDHLEQFTQPGVIEQMAYLLIIVGAVTFLLSFFGYWGAIRESQCLLTTYGLLLLVILVAQVTAIGLAAAYKDRAETETKNYLQTTITNYYTNNDRNQSDAVTLMWNYMMTELQCCGVNDYRDFNLSDKWNKSKNDMLLPPACCVPSSLFKPFDKNCPYAPTDTNSYYKKGCFNALIDWIVYHRNLVIIVAIGVGLVQLIAIALAFCLCKSIDKYRGMRL